jgi:hypothetical protein
MTTMRRHGISSLRTANEATLENRPREALLLELSIDLANHPQFAGSLFRAIRMNRNCSHHVVQANGANRHTDISWMAELLHEVQYLSDPIARGEHGRASRAVASLAHGIATLAGLRVDGLPVSNPWALERAEARGVLRTWGREFDPALPRASARLSASRSYLESNYAA